MWEHYRRTFVGMQIMMVIMMSIAWFITRQPMQVLAILVVMECFSVLGAAWGMRLKGKFVRSESRLPLRPCD